jgi:hypothetical protein
MNILLINPLSVEEFSESYGIKVVSLPFNLLCLASYLSQHNHQIQLAKHHRKYCEGEDCVISLYLLREMTEKLGIKFTEKEKELFL